MIVPTEWLTQRAEDAPLTRHRMLSSMASLRIRIAWERLKAEAEEGDELWAFENPPGTRRKLGHQTGYALVRDGEVVRSVVVTRE